MDLRILAVSPLALEQSDARVPHRGISTTEEASAKRGAPRVSSLRALLKRPAQHRPQRMTAITVRALLTCITMLHRYGGFAFLFFLSAGGKRGRKWGCCFNLIAIYIFFRLAQGTGEVGASSVMCMHVGMCYSTMRMSCVTIVNLVQKALLFCAKCFLYLALFDRFLVGCKNEIQRFFLHFFARGFSCISFYHMFEQHQCIRTSPCSPHRPLSLAMLSVLLGHLRLTDRLQRRLVEFIVLVASRHVTHADLAPLIR